MKKLLLLLAAFAGIIGPSYSQNVGIGTANPLTKLDINGALSQRVTDITATNNITIAANTGMVRIVFASGNQNNLITVTSPQDGQFLTIFNEDDNTATIAGFIIPAGSAASPSVGNFVYVGGTSPSPGWKQSSNNNSGANSFTAGNGLSWAAGPTLNSVWTQNGSNDISNNNSSGRVGIGTPNPSGTLDVQGGTATGNNNGVNIIMQAQNGGGTGSNGGNVNITSGNGTTGGNPGNVNISSSTTPASGSVNINAGGGNVNIANGTSDQTIGIGNNSTGTKTVTIGGTAANSATTINGGSTGGVKVSTLSGGGVVKAAAGTGLLSAGAVNLNSSEVTGTLPVGNLPNLNGDVTGAINSNTIAADAVTTGKIADGTVANADLTTMPANTIKGSITGAGAPVDLTVAQTKAMLGIANTNSGDVTLTTIGSTPNANGATISGQILNLEPASASFGGVVTTGSQTFAGAKTFTGAGSFTAAGTGLSVTNVGSFGGGTQIGSLGSVFGTDQGSSIELGTGNGIANTVGAVPYIDFHYGVSPATAQDFNVRLQNDANLQLSIIGNARISTLSNGLVKSTGGVLSNGVTGSDIPTNTPIAGDVTGTLAASVVSKINGAALGTTTGASTGSVLQWNGSSWSPSSTGGISSYWQRESVNGYLAPATVADNVGIGTATPSAAQLQVVAGNNKIVASFSGGNAAGIYPASNVGTAISINFSGGMAESDIWNTYDPGTYTTTGFRFLQRLTATTHRDLMFLANSGNVGIGTTGPGSKLHLQGAGTLDVPQGDMVMARYWNSLTNTRASSIFHYYNSGTSKDNLAFAVSGDGGSYDQPNQLSQIKMLIQAGGNVGIGTTTPSAKLEVYAGDLGPNAGDVLDILRLRTSNTNVQYLNFFTKRSTAGTSWASADLYLQRRIDATNMGFIKWSANDNGIEFGSDASTFMKVASSGNVGIGTLSPSYTLDVSSSTGTSTFRVKSANGTPVVSGGSSYDIGGYKYVVFTGNGTFTPNGSASVEVLVVAGGGGGGGNGGGGGGAGGVVYSGSYAVSTPVSVTVGGGGGGGTSTTAGANGGNSTFGTITAYGGGGGASRDGGSAGLAGGSGGGGGGGWGGRTTPGSAPYGQGYSGGYGYDNSCASGGGGGGGAGGLGGGAGYYFSGAGGAGIQYSQFASVAGVPSGWFASGGGGGPTCTGTYGAASAGGGGYIANGANGTGGGGSGNGFSGGSGIVIIRYPSSTVFTVAPSIVANSSNNVGIGTDSPNAKLDVAGSFKANCRICLYWCDSNCNNPAAAQKQCVSMTPGSISPTLNFGGDVDSNDDMWIGFECD